jgi:hypothetical protein
MAPHHQMPQKYDKNKHKSEIFLDMKKHLKEIMVSSPEIIEKAIKDRTIIIKSLKADISHRQIAFKEIEGRYDEQFIIIKKLIEENKKLLDNNKNLMINNDILIKKLEDSTIIINVDKKEKERTLSYKLEKLSEKIPGWAGKIVFKILSSPDVLKYILMAIFCILFVASLVGWGAIATIIKPLLVLFG